MKKRTMYLLFVFQTYGKFQIILQVHFIKHKPHISEKKLHLLPKRQGQIKEFPKR